MKFGGRIRIGVLVEFADVLLVQAFAMIDQDRDGIIGPDDLAAIYNQIGERPQCAPCISLSSNSYRQP